MRPLRTPSRGCCRLLLRKPSRKLSIASRFRLLRLRDWHPDKNPDNIEAVVFLRSSQIQFDAGSRLELLAYCATQRLLDCLCPTKTDVQVAKEVFQFLQKGKTIINV